MTSRQFFMEMGRRFADDPRVFLSVKDNAQDPSKKYIQASVMLQTPGASGVIVAWATEWARLAFPVIQPTHQYAAALMATTPPPPAEIEVHPPWPTFYLAVPDGLVSIINPQGEPEPVDSMLVHVGQEHWTWIATAKNVEFSRVCFTLEEMIEPSTGDEPAAWGNDEKEYVPEEQDWRASHCLSRLLINACLAMSDPSAVRPVGKAHQWRTGQAIPSTSRVFQLNRPVRVDCRESVRQYIRGGSSRVPTVQWLVRGHWRNQAHGAQHKLRRVQWIEPFWKGGDGAPVAVREHKLGS